MSIYFSTLHKSRLRCRRKLLLGDPLGLSITASQDTRYPLTQIPCPGKGIGSASPLIPNRGGN
jgi:hypothetical protein